MPVDYLHVDAIAAAVADIYAEAEHALLAAITRQLAAGGFDDATATAWQVRKLAEARALHRTAQLLVDELERDGNVAVRRAVADGWRSGNATALTDLTEQHIGDIGPGARAADQTAGRAIQALAEATVAELRPVHSAVLRGGDDAYRRAVAGGTARKLAGARDLRRAVQDTWAGLTRRGITGFTDTSGRNWRLTSYAEMAVRTAVARAAVIGEVDAMTANGIDRCYVVDNPRECPLCVVPGTLVEGPVPEWACRLEYAGDLISIRTASGKDLTGTPDHTVLTTLGWRRLKELAPGDKVISQRREHGVAGVMPHHVQVPTPIEQFPQAGTPLLAAGPARRDLDGDVVYREIHDVRANGHLLAERYAALGEPRGDLRLVAGVGAATARLPSGDPLSLFQGAFPAADRVMGGPDPTSPFLRAGVVPPGASRFACDCRALLGRPLGDGRSDGFAARARVDARAAQVVTDAAARYPKRRPEDLGALTGLVEGYELGGLLGGQLGALFSASPQRHPGRLDSLTSPGIADADGGARLMQGLAGEVAADEVLSVSVRQFSGHVWDLQTVPRWFLTNGIVTHNCRPWEGKVLQVAGTPVAPAIATLEEAQAAGLHHPSCRHSIRPWQPGVRIVPARKPEGPEGYEAEQRQRELERGLRGWRERYAAALDDTGRQQAAKRIAAWSQRLYEHLDAHPRLARISYREHPGAGFRAPRSARTRRDAAYLASRA